MCLNCGCGIPDERHGRPENITADDLRRAAAANGQSLRESAGNILTTVDAIERERASDGGGRSGGPSAADGQAAPNGLAEPAGSQGPRPADRGSPESES